MAYSYVLYTGNGTTTNYTFSFPYLNEADVKVRVGGEITEYTFLNSSTVTISPAPASGAVIEIRRETITETPPVDFADGSVLLERDLDLISKYNLFTSQEAYDLARDGLAPDAEGNLDAQHRRIINLANPVDLDDAVNKRTLVYDYPKVETVADSISSVNVVAADLNAAVSYESDLGFITDPVNTEPLVGNSAIMAVADNIDIIADVAANISIIESADENASAAASSAASAASSASTATTQAGIATTKASEASTSASNAATSETNAAASASTATTKASQAATSATNASTSEGIASSAATSAGTSATNAASSATSASNSATSAANSASSASSSASSASNSSNTATTQATAASSSASSAASSATSASGSASTATTKATQAATSATSSAASATLANDWATKTSGPVAGGEYSAKYHANQVAANTSAAAASATAAASSATSASTSATNAASSASSASTSATSASSSATSASTSATTATTQAGIATTKAGEASTSATSASGSATTATTQAGIATTKASEASTSASNAASSASTASTQAGIATTKASEAASSATSASSSATSAAASAASAAALLDNFDDRYLGPKSSAPTVDNDGNALVVGALYFDTTSGKMRVNTASGWVDASSASQAALTVYRYTATAGQTTFSGSDVNAQTLAYLVGGIVVTLNGSVIVGSGVDYTASNGTSVVLATGATVGDTLEVYAFSSFSIASLNGSAIVDGTITSAKLATSLDLGSI